MEEKKQYKEGHFIGLWIGICSAIFAGLGVIYGMISKNFSLIGVGPAIGVSVGVAIGSSMEAKAKKEGKIIPRTAKDRNTMKVLGITGLIVFVILVVTLLIILLGGK